MNQFSIWPWFGFRESPYSHEKLSVGEEGDRLFVGRAAEIQAFQMRIGSGGPHATVEGTAGVGKSSLVAVASYRMMRDSALAHNGNLFVPAEQFMQIGDDPGAFEDRLYRNIAQTLINNADAFRQAECLIPSIDALDKWLNAPQYRTAQAGGFGFSGGYGSEPNTSDGFTHEGFAAAIRSELERLFPTDGSGGVICVIDNVELLKTSVAARDALESLRDRVFDLPGLRWVLCGSRGIVSRARSQRLSGFFAAPQRVSPITDEESVELIRRRLEYFGDEGSRPPVSPEAFQFLYQALNNNLRDALSHAQTFSEWLYGELAPRKVQPPDSGEAQRYLEAWMVAQADDAYSDAKGIQKRVWQFFDAMALAGGTARSADFEQFNFSTQQQFGSSVTSLETANLVVREVDPDDGNRKLATITPQGWLVYFHRNRYLLPSSSEPQLPLEGV